MIKNPSSLKNEANKYKTDKFTLHQEKPGRWKVSGRDSNGKYRRIRFDAKDLNEAMTLANDVLEEQATPANIPWQSETVEHIQISDALLRAAKDRTWTDKNRKKDEFNCGYFLNWVDHKGLTYWHELRYEQMLEYKKYLIDKGYAYDTVRLYFQPIRRTSVWMAANWPNRYINICQALRISQKDVSKKTYKSNRNPYMPIHEILDFMDWMDRNNKPVSLIIGVALQGLAGLQMLEAIRLTIDKFNGEEGTIIIDGVVKNDYRIRKIPIPKVVSWLIRKNGVVSMYSDNEQYGKALRRVLDEWNPKSEIKPKDFRNTIQTSAIDGGWDSYFLDRYVGHAPNTVRRKHYFCDNEERLIPLLRDNVIKYIEKEISSWKAPTDTTILPGPRLVVNQ